MLKLQLYIHGIGRIMPEAAPGGASRRLSAKEPDYTGIIAPMQLRRMSKAVRMGIGAARACLADVGIERPDAIAVGTALGCLQDTEIFLCKMIAQDERMLTPTAFIQSTHNTVAGQIALLTGCTGYNTTVSQRGHSAEGALLSAAMQLAERDTDAILLGGVDELTDSAFDLMQRAGMYANGRIAGEGAAFILLRSAAAGAKAQIGGLHFFTESRDELAVARIQRLLADAHPGEDLIILATGDSTALRLKDALKELRIRQHNEAATWGTAIVAVVVGMIQDWPADAVRIWVVSEAGCGDWAVWLLERAEA